MSRRPDRRPARPLAAALPGLVALGALVGCTAPAGASDEEIARWVDEQADAAPAGALASAVARVGPGDGGADTPDPADAAVTMTFERPSHLDGLQLRCLGDGTVDLTVHVTTEDAPGSTRTTSTTYPAVPCGADGTEDELDLDGVTSVGVGGSADRRGAWSVAVVGRAG